MFLRFYTWLRDGFAKKFNDPSIQKYIWEQLDKVNQLASPTRRDRLLSALSSSDEEELDVEKTPLTARKACKICGSTTIHSKILPLSSWKKCPFGTVEAKFAHKARAFVNRHLQEQRIDSTDMTVVKQKIEEAKRVLG